MGQFTIHTPDGPLSARLFKPVGISGKLPAVFFIHGWKTDQQGLAAFAESLVGLGHICLTFDLPGHGESSGDKTALSRKDFFQGVLAAYDFFTGQEQVHTQSVYVVSASFGSYLAVLLSAERPVKGLVLRVPSNYPDEGYTEPKLRADGDAGVDEWRKQSSLLSILLPYL